MGVKCKIKRSDIYFDENYDLSACAKTRDYNVLLLFYLYLQDNDNYPLLNLIFNQTQTSNKKMSLIKTLFLTRDRIPAL